MAIPYSLTAFPSPAPSPVVASHWPCRVACLGLLLFAACGVIDYDIQRSNFFAPPSQKRDFGVIYFHYADGADPYQVHFRRVKGGYAMIAPLYEGEHDDHINFTATRNRERGTFIGIEGKFSF